MRTSDLTPFSPKLLAFLAGSAITLAAGYAEEPKPVTSVPVVPAAETKAPALAAQSSVQFIDITKAAGLENLSAQHVKFADLNGDGRPDVVVLTADKCRIFLNTPVSQPKDTPESSALNFKFVEVTADTHLPVVRNADVLVFADLNNDGKADAILARYQDLNNPKAVPIADEPKVSAWMEGKGDGTFGTVHELPVKKATTCAIAVGDINRDGYLDLYLGNWYTQYGASVEAYPGDIVLSHNWGRGRCEWERAGLPSDDAKFDEQTDAAGRPTYGALIVNLIAKNNAEEEVALYELNYGRRADRMWVRTKSDEKAKIAFEDAGVRLGIDGDADRSGKYPTWMKEVAKKNPQLDRPDEPPFRSHGNTFDAAIGDINNDGLFDIFVTEITHAWGGDSSDRSRFLVQRRGADGKTTFQYDPKLSVDRAPASANTLGPGGKIPNWNQGDIWCELADLDHDGRLDLILASGEYPDPPPTDNKLRIFHQEPDGSFKDITPGTGIAHPGCGQISLADVDGDGDMDIIAGQSYNRFTAELTDATNKAQNTKGPAVRLFLNQTSDKKPNSSITYVFEGDSAFDNVSRDALGVIARLTTTNQDGSKLVQSRQLVAIGGHAGKQNQFLLHFGLAGAKKADKLEILWPGYVDPQFQPQMETAGANLEAGHHLIKTKGSELLKQREPELDREVPPANDAKKK